MIREYYVKIMAKNLQDLKVELEGATNHADELSRELEAEHAEEMAKLKKQHEEDLVHERAEMEKDNLGKFWISKVLKPKVSKVLN
jgi:hypothetical protein